MTSALFLSFSAARVMAFSSSSVNRDPGFTLESFFVALHGEPGNLWRYGCVPVATPVLRVLDDDVAGIIGRFIEGAEVSDKTLALDLIEEVGLIPGHYLSKAHTRKWWKKEQFVPKVADRLTYPEWMKTGKKSCLDYAKERVEEILATHKPTPLTDDQEDAIENILKEAKEYYRKKGLIPDEEWAKYKKIIESPEYPFA